MTKLYYAKADTAPATGEPLYLREDGEWVPSKGEGDTFETEIAAAAAAKKAGIPEGYNLDCSEFKEIPDEEPTAEEMHEAIDSSDVPDEVKAVAHEGVASGAPKVADIKEPPKPFIATMTDYINEQGLHIQHVEAAPGHILPPEVAERPFVAHARSDIPVKGAGQVPNVPIAAKIAAKTIEEAYAAADEAIQEEAIRIQAQFEAQYQREQLAGAGRMGMPGQGMPPGMMGR